MKILVLSNLYPPFQLGGYETACKNTVEGLRQRGHSVHVLTSPSHYPGENDPPYVQRTLTLRNFHSAQINGHHGVLRRFESSLSNITNTVVFTELITKLRPDCIYFWNLIGIGGMGLLDAANRLEIPWVFHLMDDVPAAMRRGMGLPALSLFHAAHGEIYRQGRIIAMSQNLLNEIKRLSGITFTGHLEIIPGWVDTNRPVMTRSYQAGNITRFVNAGTMDNKKGVDLILNAAQRLTGNGLTKFQIDLYGPGNISHYIDHCKAVGLADHVRFHGPQPQQNLLSIYEKADAFLFPTWEREPFGFAPVEAASMGCLPVITATCGIAERLVHGVHCLKIERTTEGLLQAMTDIMTGRIDLANLGMCCQKITRQDLSFKTCLDQIEKILAGAAVPFRDRRIQLWKETALTLMKHNLAAQYFLQQSDQIP